MGSSRIKSVRQRLANGRLPPASFFEDKRRKKKITPRSIPKDRQEVPDIDLTGEGKYIRRYDNSLQKQMFRRQKVRRKKALDDAIQHGIGAAEHDPKLKKMLPKYIKAVKHDFAHNPADYSFISPRVGSPVHSDITAPEKKYYTKTPLEHSKPAYYTEETLQRFTKLNKSARIDAVRQRLAYTGKHFIKPKGTTDEMVNDAFKRPQYQDQQYTQRLDKVQKEFESMRPEILERKHGKGMGKYNVPGLNDYGSLCVDEATCGASSAALWNKLIESGFTRKTSSSGKWWLYWTGC
jgi:hypothetical protein